MPPIVFDEKFKLELERQANGFVEILDIWIDLLPNDPDHRLSYHFVSFNHPIEYDGTVYQPIGLIRSSLNDTQSGEERTMTLTLDGIHEVDVEGVNFRIFVRRLELRGSRILLRRLPAYRETMTPKILFRGYISSVVMTPTTIQCECVGNLKKWGSTMVPSRLAGPGCQVPFGSDACGVIAEQGVTSLAQVETEDGFKAIYTSSSNAELSADRLMVTDPDVLSSITDENHFLNGYVLISDTADTEAGRSKRYYVGRYSMIRSFTPSAGRIKLVQPLPISDLVGVTLQYRASCGHSRKECKRWQNLLNYAGISVPKIPTLGVTAERY